MIQTQLIASMRSYVEVSPDQQFRDSAVNSKLLAYLSGPTSATLDIASQLTKLDSRNPQQGHWLNPLVARREVQNAGNLPNPTGLDTWNV